MQNLSSPTAERGYGGERASRTEEQREEKRREESASARSSRPRIGSQSIYTGGVLIPGLIGRPRQCRAPGKTSLMHPRCIEGSPRAATTCVASPVDPVAVSLLFEPPLAKGDPLTERGMN